MRLFTDLHRSTKTYRDPRMAQAKADAFVESLGEDMRYIVIDAGDNRYALCFIPSSDQQWRCRQIADAGFCVAF